MPVKKENNIEVFKQGPVLYETHLFQFPLMVLSKRDRQKKLIETAKTKRSLIYYEYVDDQGIKRFWELKPNTISGYPGDFDVKVLGTLFWLCTQEGQYPPPKRWAFTDKLETIRDITGRKGKSGITDVKKALILWSDTIIRTNAIWLREEGQYWDQGKGFANFNFWQYHERDKPIPGGGIADHHYLDFTDDLLTLMANLKIRPADFHFWINLKPKDRAFYEITAPRFYGLKHNPYADFEYLDLCKRLGITAELTIGRARKTLQPIHDDMGSGTHGHKWINKAVWVNEDEPKYNPDNPWRLHYYPGHRVSLEFREGDQLFQAFCKNNGLQSSATLPPVSKEKELAQAIGKILGNAEQNMGTYILYARLGLSDKIPVGVFKQGLQQVKIEVEQKRVNEENKARWFMAYLRNRLSKEYAIDLDVLFRSAKQKKLLNRQQRAKKHVNKESQSQQNSSTKKDADQLRSKLAHDLDLSQT